ncbi:MAG: ParB/RepB/Spo0J family partition protein, partial [Firmicutes bacterium]|nr:ParB/RepB/Spo0J family partition protein [Bacillota bacterium]
MAMKKSGLGRGLSALIDNDETVENIDKESIIEVDINKIEPDENQPRTNFNNDSLNELADSIRNLGIVNPIVAKKNGEFYKIITGERRWRAARIAGIKTVPVIIKEYSELETIEVALIENVQREDLNLIEEAMTYKKLAEEFNLSQEEISKKIGKSRTVVTNAMRLLKLDQRVQNFLSEGKISAGHARALLGIENNDIQFETAEKIIDDGISVRETEELVKIINEKKEEVSEEKNEIKTDNI